MTTTNHSDGAGNPAPEPCQLLKTDAIGRTRMSPVQRETILIPDEVRQHPEQYRQIDEEITT